MASRTSIYTNALKLPDWVMGGEFGDISTIMNNRDRQYEAVAQAEQQTEKNQYDLEAKQREERMREILNDRMGNSRPATIRDAYQQMADAAYEAGDPESALEYEAKREAYDQAQLAKKRAEFSGAIGIADNAGYDRVNELYPGVLTPDDYNRNQRRKREEGAADKNKDEKMVTLYGPDGTPEMIPQSQYNAMVKAGYIDPKLDDRDSRQIRADYERSKKEASGEEESDSWFLPYSRPVPSPTPMAAQSEPKQDAKGDRSRAQPSVKDQVKEIRLKRKVQNG